MRTYTALVALFLAASASPALCAPIVTLKATSQQARGVAVADLAKALAKGIASGTGFAALEEGVEDLIGDDSNSSQKRGLSKADIALLKRAVSLGTLGKELGKGIATGGGLAALLAGAEHFLDGDSDSDASAPQRRGIGSILGAGVDDTIGDVIKKGIAGGLGSAVGGAAIEGLINEITGGEDSSSNSKRGIASILGAGIEDTLGDVIKKGIAGGLGSTVGGAAIEGIIDDITGDDSSSSSKRDILNAREPVNLSPIEKGLIGTGVSLGVSQIAGEVIDEVEGLFGDDDSSSASKRSVEAREPANLSPLAKGIIGTGVSLGVGSIAGDVIDDIENLFDGDDSSSASKRDFNGLEALD